MEIGVLQEQTVESFIDELWISAQREMAAVSEYTLTDRIRQDGLAHRRSRLSDDESITYLARRGNRHIGYASAEVQTPPPIFQQERECHIKELFVRKADRREGIALGLLDTIEAWGLANDCTRLALNVNMENRPAKALYETAGYHITRYNMKNQLRSNE